MVEFEAGQTATPDSSVNNRHSPLSPTILEPTISHRTKAFFVSLVLSPVALFLLLSSVASMQEWAAVGQPLSSAEGTAGLLISAILFMLIGSFSTSTSVGIAVTTIWALAYAVVAAIFRASLDLNAASYAIERNYRSQTDIIFETTATTWSGLPLLILAICLGALIATMLARKNRKLESAALQSGGKIPRWAQPLAPDALHGDATWFANPGSILPPGRARIHLSVLVVDMLIAVLVWTLLVAAAPSDVTVVARYGSVGLALKDANPTITIGLVICLLVLTVSAGWSLFGPLISTSSLMALPGLILFPVIASLSGTVATPEAPVSTALAIAGPVVAALGLTTICLTWGIHWVRTAPIQARSASHSDKNMQLAAALPNISP